MTTLAVLGIWALIAVTVWLALTGQRRFIASSRAWPWFFGAVIAELVAIALVLVALR